LGTTVLGAIYVGWLISFYMRLRIMDHHTVIMNPRIPDDHVGSWLVILVCIVTWMGDIGGMVIGNFLGSKKLAPTISPSKTWEGAIGGVLCGTTSGTFLGLYLGFDLTASITISLLMSVFGLVGDLCESALKRNLGLKDFGGAFASHGGVLDRIDSLLFTAPVAYYFILVFLSPR
jgi:phosphatidate cytidylyltransferase